MKAYYATYRDKVYRLVDHDTRIKVTFSEPKQTNSSTAFLENVKEVQVNIGISQMDPYLDGNKGAGLILKKKLKDEGTTEIPFLSPFYQLNIAYTLFDIRANAVVDRGVAIQDVPANFFSYNLGLDEEDEIISRLGIDLHSSLEKGYVDSAPMGVMRYVDAPQFSLKIEKLYVTQKTMAGFSVAPQKEGSPLTELHPQMPRPTVPPYNHTHYNPGPFDYNGFPIEWLEGYGWDCMPLTNGGINGHASMNNFAHAYDDTAEGLRDPITIYSSEEDGLIFDPIIIKFRPRMIRFNTTILLMSIAACNSDNIDTILAENKGSEDPDVVITPQPPIMHCPFGIHPEAGDEDLGENESDKPAVVVPDDSIVTEGGNMSTTQMACGCGCTTVV